MSRTKTTLFVAVLAVLAVGLLEMAFALLASISTAVDQVLGTAPATVPDERLGHRPNPAYPEHDARGFRNPTVPVRAPIVALGDSQTYGMDVASADAWPRRLEAMIGRPVYSMAYGGYGPTHSLVLWDEAASLQPEIVEAFYAGNDLFDAFDHVYNRGQLEELKTPSESVQADVRAAERAEPIAERVSRMFEMGAAEPSSLRRLLSQHSRLYGLLRTTWQVGRRAIHDGAPQDGWATAKAFAAAHSDYCEVFSDERFDTVFTSPYRLSALDLRDPRIAEGLHISLRAMEAMHQRAAAGGRRFLVVLIPTKETVFRPVLHDSTESYRNLIESEESVRQATRRFLEHAGIEFVDALAALQELLATGIQPYPASQDGHPNERGHDVIARVVAAELAAAK